MSWRTSSIISPAMIQTPTTTGRKYRRIGMPPYQKPGRSLALYAHREWTVVLALGRARRVLSGLS